MKTLFLKQCIRCMKAEQCTSDSFFSCTKLGKNLIAKFENSLSSTTSALRHCGCTAARLMRMALLGGV
ncbi:hypothetical protein CSUI_010910 [Cystoisospora suis]|uniref:Uncharacterized protein n=1 Tax=Cystoisospora suis TaxID=483139 RepID=A0A2C6KDM1_9APIC|nr:hypothetical protein CSUI_010910 [Cystoisospora suis]